MAVLGGCSDSSRKAETPPGAMDPRLLYQLLSFEHEGLILDVRVQGWGSAGLGELLPLQPRAEHCPVGMLMEPRDAAPTRLRCGDQSEAGPAVWLLALHTANAANSSLIPA